MKTFLRRLEILNFLRTQHSAVSTDAIYHHLENAGYLDSYQIQTKSLQRLIQRDLVFLLGEKNQDDDLEPESSLAQPAQKDEHSSFEQQAHFDNDFGLYLEKGQGKSQLWKLSPYQQLNYDFERMPAFMALALSLTEKHLKQVLPADTQAELKRLFENAQQKLAKSEQKLSSRHYQRLTQSVEFFQRGQRLHGASFDPTILDKIYRAILLGKRISISYRRHQQSTEYQLHPYGVVIMLPKLYLIAKKHNDMNRQESFRSFLVHKIDDVTISQFNHLVPQDFNLRDYLDQGHMDVLLSSKDSQSYPLRLEITTDTNSNLLADLNENPISMDQTLSRKSARLWQLDATVKRTVQLRNWLMSLGNQAKILSPEIIKQDVLQELHAILSRY